MWKLPKTVHNPDYDSLIKTALVAHLGEAIRELQRNQQQQECSVVVESGSEPAQTLCSVLEALFVHKLRDSFIDKVTNALKGDVVRQPCPNFWPFLLRFSHRHTTEYLTDSCPWLRSDTGRCRGWIRLVLNDGMLTSYFDLLAGEKRLLNDFYEKQAFLRDLENVDIALKLLRGIESLQFRLAVNSSILNNWNTTPLLLAGLWVPPTHVIQEAVVQGVDATLCFADEDEPRQHQPTKPATPEPPKLDADLAFRLIIDSDSKAIPTSMHSIQAEAAALPNTPVTSLASSYGLLTVGGHSEKATPSASPRLGQLGTDIVPENPSQPVETAQTATQDQCHDSAVDRAEEECPFEPLTTYEEEEPLRRNVTFEDLLVNYSVSSIGSALIKGPEIACATNPVVNRVGSDDSEFELVTEPEKPSATLTSMLKTINHERGLVEQNYRCFDCSRPIGLIYGPARVCGFTGGYFCADCHSDDEEIIPARVFLNGDWSKRKIGTSARKFLNDITFDPLFDSVEFDGDIYTHQPQFAALLSVRTQLQHLSAFILTCRTAGVNDSFRSRFAGKNYLYENLHLYCLADLPLVQTGHLAQHLAKIVTFGKQHVISCSVCVMKGFLCESCKSDAVIFPFDVDSTYRCLGCGAVFHSQCMDGLIPCPRCDRWKAKGAIEIETETEIDVETE